MGTPFESIVAEWGVLFLTYKNLKRGRTKGTLLAGVLFVCPYMAEARRDGMRIRDGPA